MPANNVEFVREVYDAFARRDVARIFSALAPDVEITQSSALPWGGTHRGHEGARAFFTALTTNITSAVTIERFISAGDQVIAIGSTRGTVNATQAPFDVPFAHVWTVREGAVARMEFYIDNPTMLPALERK